MNKVSIYDLMAFSAELQALDVEPPAAITRGLALDDILDEAAREERPASLLDMSEDDLRRHVRDQAIRRHSTGNPLDPRGLMSGVEIVRKSLVAEMVKKSRGDLDRVAEDLQALFEPLARPLVDGARKHNFTYATTSDEVIRRNDPDAVEAWRAIPAAWAGISEIVDVRIHMSTLFGVSPVITDMPRRHRRGPEMTDYSVAFAAGDNWSDRGDYNLDGLLENDIDWLALAAGGLRINSPSETLAKIERRRAAQYRGLARSEHAEQPDADSTAMIAAHGSGH